MPKQIAKGLVVETVGDILDRTDADRAARAAAKTMSNAPDPFEACKIEIDDLYDEARNWLDGTPIKSQAEANDVASLIDRFGQAWKAADHARDAEKRPHMEAANAVQAKYNPLLKRADDAKRTAKSAVTAYQVELRKAQEEIARATRAEADRVAAEAIAAAKAANAAADLTAREDAEAKIEEAQRLAAIAKVAEQAKPQAKSAFGGRALGLKSVWTPTLTDGVLLMRHYWVRPERRAEIEAFMLDMARKDVRAGARSIPGVEITEDFTV